MSFACAKLKSPQSVTASSGDTSQCGVCFCDGGHLSAAYKGRCAAILPRSVLTRCAPCAPHAASAGSLVPVSQAPPLYRTQTLIALERIASEDWSASKFCKRKGASAPVHKSEKPAPLNAWPRSLRGKKQAVDGEYQALMTT